jgi:hypothetical protein
MRVTVALLVCAGIVAGTCWPATRACAADKATEEARQHFLKGQQLFDVGRWDEAADAFEKAYATRSDPIFIYNMAQSYRRKGDAKRALDLYKNYLIKAPKSPQRPEVEERIRALQKQLDDEAAARASAAPPVLPYPTVVPPASVPAPVAPAPMPGPNPDQPSVAPVSTEPVPAQPSTSSSTSAQPSPAPVMLAPAPASAPTAPAQPDPPPTSAAPPATLTQTPALVPPRPGRGLRIAGIVSGLTGIAVVGAGVVFGAEAKSYSDSVENGNVFNPDFDTRGKRYETLQWVSYGVGAGLVATGALLYGLGVASGREPPVAIAPIPVAGGAGLSAQGVF